MGFLGVYRALYDYAPTAEGELAINDGDLVFVLDRGEDGWWRAKKKAASEDEDEPEGLIPENYIEEVRIPTMASIGLGVDIRYRQNQSALRRPSTTTPAKRTRNCPLPKMKPSRSTTRRIQIGRWWARKESLDSHRQITSSWQRPHHLLLNDHSLYSMSRKSQIPQHQAHRLARFTVPQLLWQA